MLKTLIKSLENKPLNPWTLFSNLIGEELNLIIPEAVMFSKGKNVKLVKRRHVHAKEKKICYSNRIQ